MINKPAGFATRSIHTGQEPDNETGAVSLPIYQTSTFQQSDFADYKFDYSRADNPTRRNLEETLTSLKKVRVPRHSVRGWQRNRQYSNS